MIVIEIEGEPNFCLRDSHFEISFHKGTLCFKGYDVSSENVYVERQITLDYRQECKLRYIEGDSVGHGWASKETDYDPAKYEAFMVGKMLGEV